MHCVETEIVHSRIKDQVNDISKELQSLSTLDTTPQTTSFNYRSATFRPDPFHDVSRYLPQHQAIITTQDNWKISLSNEMTNQILAIHQHNIIGKYIFDFIDPTYRHTLLDKILKSRDQQRQNSNILIISGDIIPIVKLDGTKTSVSLWLKEKKRNGNLIFIWILEEVFSTTFKLELKEDNTIASMDNTSLLGLDSIVNKPIQALIPHYNPTEKFFGCRTSLNAYFPVMIGHSDNNKTIRITSMPILTGLLTISRSAPKTILHCHPNFCKYLFGYPSLDTLPLATILPQSTPLIDALEHDQLLEDGYVLNQHICKNILKEPTVYVVHRDGSRFEVDLQIKLNNAKDQYLVWINFSREEVFQQHGHVKATRPPITRATSRPNRSQSVVDRPFIQDPLWPSIGEYSAQTHKTNIDDYEIIDELGQGAYGLVKLAYLKKDMEKKRVVIKYVIKSRILIDCWTRDRKLGLIPAEIHVLHTLKKMPHINCSDMLDYFEDEDNYYIVSDLYGAGMDLFDYIELKEDGISENEIRSIFYQVVCAVGHLHDHNIVHRDIKDENVILDMKGGVRLIDFGSAAYLKEGKLYETFVGTLDYAAPEILKGESYTGPPQDIWACGTLLYTLIYRENPFYNIDEIMSRELRIPYVLSEESVDLIKKMLNRNTKERPNIHQVLAHPWFQSK